MCDYISYDDFDFDLDFSVKCWFSIEIGCFAFGIYRVSSVDLKTDNKIRDQHAFGRHPLTSCLAEFWL